MANMFHKVLAADILTISAISVFDKVSMVRSLKQFLVCPETGRRFKNPVMLLEPVGKYKRGTILDLSASILKKHTPLSGESNGFVTRDAHLRRLASELNDLEQKTRYPSLEAYADVVRDICTCPIELDQLDDPVTVAGSGQSYSHAFISKWFQQLIAASSDTNPVVRDPLGMNLSGKEKALIPNKILAEVLAVIRKIESNLPIPDLDYSAKPSVTHTFTGHRKGVGVTNLRYLPGTNYLVSTGYDEKVYLWDLKRKQPLRGYSGEFAYQFSSCDLDGGLFATAGYSICIWDTKERGLVEKIGQERRNTYSSMLYSKETNSLITGMANGLVRIWDGKTKEIRAEVSVGTCQVPIIGLLEISDNEVLCISEGGHFGILNLDSLSMTFTQKTWETFSSFQPLLNENTYLLGHYDGSLSIWEKQDSELEEQGERLKICDKPIISITPLKDNYCAVVSGEDSDTKNTVYIVDFEKREIVQAFTLDKCKTVLCLPNGDLVCPGDNKIEILRFQAK
jgi:WD40 repeat protein